MDVLANVLTATRVQGAIFCHTQLRAPWGMRFEPAAQAGFHIVSRGACWIQVHGAAPPLQLVQGDVVLLPHGAGHAITDQLATPTRLIGELIAEHDTAVGGVLRAGGGGAETELLCGAYRFDGDGPHPLLALLPPLIHIPAEQASALGELHAVVALLARESAGGPGSETITARLVDVLFVYIVRTWLARQPEGAAGWLGALRDPSIGAALTLIHREPGQAWSVGRLAGQVALSRAAFARRFAALVGEPPLTYLTRWRMDMAARLLRETNQPLPAIATRVGYESEFAFNRALKRSRGVAPGRYRAEARQSA